MKSPKFIAIMIALFVLGWTFSGFLVAEDEFEIVKPDTAKSQKIIDVRVKDFTAQNFQDELVITGRSQASRFLDIRAEIDGALTTLKAKEGDAVQKGDPLAVIEIKDRQARLAEARQRVTQRQIEYDAAKSLESQGFNSRIRLSQALSDLKNAKAALKGAETDLNKVNILSPFDGVLLTQNVEQGNYLKAGDTVFTLVDLNPIEFVGFAPERHIQSLALDAPVDIVFLDGSKTTGKISYIAPAASDETRTFRVIISSLNESLAIKSGLTAKLYIPLPVKKAHKISPSILALNDQGQIGLKIVDQKNRIQFKPIKILSDRPDGMWVDGLAENEKIVTVGQDFVVEGQQVNPVLSDSEGFL